MTRKRRMTRTIEPRSGFTIAIPISPLETIANIIRRNGFKLFIIVLSLISIGAYIFYLLNGLGLAYNDARSHLDIGRRVVESLKPGLAQLGSVWLPLPHLLMVPTIWLDFFWHTGLSGAIQSMISFVLSAVLIYFFLKRINVGMIGRIMGVIIFVANINILYLQSTAMTELLLLATMTAGVYDLLRWEQTDKIVYFIRSSFWIMLSTLIRYDGWFLFAYAVAVIGIITFIKKGYTVTEGKILFFCTLAGLGIVAWFVWNLLIFGDPFYFAFGPYSARAQQEQLESAGELYTKGKVGLSLKTYFYAMAYNSNMFILLVGILGSVVFFFDKSIRLSTKVVLSCLFAPFLFNVLALYLGHSVLFVQGVIGNTWFNVRYGVMLMPTVAVMTGYLVDRAVGLRVLLIGLIAFVLMFTFVNGDAVTIDDARFGSSQKNVTEVSGWLKENAKEKQGFVLISAASHDAIIFSSSMQMSRFIHEGTGEYWDVATKNPSRWARWIIMRTNDPNDQTFELVNQTNELQYYNLVGKYPFADIYELKEEHIPQLHLEEVY